MQRHDIASVEATLYKRHVPAGLDIVVHDNPSELNGYTLRGGNSFTIFCLPFEKGSLLKGKKLLPFRENFCLLVLILFH